MTPVREGGFAAGDFEDGLKGGQQKKIRTMLERAKSCPWLMFCAVVDEIETLVPNRNNKEASNAGGGSSALGVMLTYFGGLQNIPNVFMFGATNMRNDIDAAFARRMSGKIFVGLPTARSRKCWNPRVLENDGKTKKIDPRLIIPTRINKQQDDTNEATNNNNAEKNSIDISAREALTRLTTNFSGAQMEMVMAELQQFYSSRFQEKPDEIVTVTKEDVFTVVNIVCERERIFLGSRSVPALLESNLCLNNANNQTPADDDESSANTNDALQAELDFETNFSEVIKRKMSNWSGRMFLNLSSVFEGKEISKFESPYLEIQTRDRRTNRTGVHTLRQQHISSEEGESTPTVSPDFFKRLFVQLGVDLDMNAVKLMDNAFFMNEGLEKEDDIVRVMNEEVNQCKEYDRSLMILDLDAGFVDVNFDNDMSHESIHRNTLFNSMLAIAKDFPSCDASKERFFFVACVTSYSCIASRFHYNLQWPKNTLRSFSETKKSAASSNPRQCIFCKEWFTEEQLDQQSGGQQPCNPHPKDAKFSREAGGTGATAYTADSALDRAVLESSQRTAIQRSKYHYDCCGAPFNSPNRCSNWQPTTEQPTPEHKLKPLPDAENDVPNRCQKKHETVPTLPSMTRVWCNCCSLPIADTSTKSEISCKMCSSGDHDVERPVWIEKNEAGCDECEVKYTGVEFIEELFVESFKRKGYVDTSVASCVYDWWRKDRGSGEWMLLSWDQAAFFESLRRQYVEGDGYGNFPVDNDYTKRTQLPWSPTYPKSAQQFVSHRIFTDRNQWKPLDIKVGDNNNDDDNAANTTSAVIEFQSQSLTHQQKNENENIDIEHFRYVRPALVPLQSEPLRSACLSPEHAPSKGRICPDQDPKHWRQHTHTLPLELQRLASTIAKMLKEETT